jgi:hypothetical protein
MRFKFFFLLMLIVRADAWTQMPFSNFLKTYVETKGVEVGQATLNDHNIPGDPTIINTSFKTVTINDEYPKVLKAFRRTVEILF